LGAQDPDVGDAGIQGTLRLALPKGSLEAATLDLFRDADLPVQRASDRDYRPSIDDPRIADVRILRPQEIPRYVAEGLFDLGICGRDWVEETESEVETLAVLKYSKVSERPVRIVIAVPQESRWERPEDLPDGVRISTELPELTRRYFEKLGIKPKVHLSYGATEAKVPDIVDAIVDVTETGSSLRAAGLKIIGTVLESYSELIANRESAADPAKRQAMEELKILLLGVLDARGRVLVKLNVGRDDLERVIAILPAMKAPTVNQLHDDGYFAVETVVPKSRINVLIPELKAAGASDIVELPITKIVP
jgi:ATP phosphoribosyltransferase